MYPVGVRMCDGFHEYVECPTHLHQDLHHIYEYVLHIYDRVYATFTNILLHIYDRVYVTFTNTFTSR